jgi:hypothetical protein
MKALSSNSDARAIVTLTVKRTAENSRHTYGAFHLDVAGGQKAVTGYTLEPGGLSGPTHLSGNLLPAGTYRLDWQPVPGEGNKLVLFNEHLPRQRQFQLNRAADVQSGSPYLVLSLTPVYSTGEFLQHAARTAGFEVEALLRKHGLDNVVLRIEDF